MITVEKINDTTFKVTVENSTTTTHHVTLSPAYHEKLTHNKATPEQLIEKSFEFLLQRESNTSILSRFDLPVISQYFPQYESKIPQML
jgi:hypothetical protein